ncbi:NUDIX domain-containing protein [Actinosynnema sp. NPDC047251]|uniref:NUDIX hydrolase n=1 Tax=Saccharothrix espanaensis TaxID=103731 RepID=UPI0002F7E73F|nr:NUDIX domain-containing protein [Saccharothrix espanaensis]
MSRIDYLNEPNAPRATGIRVAVSAVVRDQGGRILMIRRADNDKYAIPGGGQDVGETLAAAVVREVEEETGIRVEVTGLVGLYSNPAHVIAYDDGEVRQEFSICFRARPLGGDLRTSDESTEVLWAEPTDLDDLDIHPSIRLRIVHGLIDDRAPYFT